MLQPSQVLLEDNHCLVVNKPGGLLTQGAPAGIPTLEAEVKAYLRDRYDKQGRVYLGVVHRVDRPVSGVVLFTKQTKSTQRLSEQFRNRQVTKLYWAAVEGDVEADAGTWQDWIRKVPNEPRAEVCSEEVQDAKNATLRFRVLARDTGYTLLELEPQTGRYHQIRLQTAVRGHPVLGDELYGAKTTFGPLVDDPRDRIIALHAKSLTFLHPIRYEPVTVEGPVPECWAILNLELKHD
ncbi:MAG: RluA family pseudouridine synthase [Gemmataceae bacterium]